MAPRDTDSDLDRPVAARVPALREVSVRKKTERVEYPTSDDRDACDLLHSDEGRADPTEDEHLPETNLVPGLDDPKERRSRKRLPERTRLSEFQRGAER